MPNMEICRHSGGIIFHLTPEEKEVIDLKSELETMKSEMSSKMKELTLLINKVTGGEQ